MYKTKIKRVEQVLCKLHFVQWDRFTRDDRHTLTFYGWINRQKDSYKDFVVVSMALDGEVVATSYVTSSDRYSKVIGEILGFEEANHSPCIRVEDNFNINNMIKINK